MTKVVMSGGIAGKAQEPWAGVGAGGAVRRKASVVFGE